MDKIYTIGFTQKNAETFFNLLKDNRVELVIDIRLNNTSQLSSFTKFPDIQYFLRELCRIDYIHDLKFAPLDSTLKKFKNKSITWQQYVIEYLQTIYSRNINEHIELSYSKNNNICLLCSEPDSENCHRSLVANEFKNVFSPLYVIDL